MTKTLSAFFSRADENYFGGAMRYVKVGNTQIVCNIMKDMIDVDTFKIEMKNPYSPVYMTCIEQAKKDLREKARPELVTVPESPMFNAPEAVVVTVPRLELVRQGGRQYAETREIDEALLSEIGSPMILEEQYAAIVNGSMQPKP